MDLDKPSTDHDDRFGSAADERLPLALLPFSISKRGMEQTDEKCDRAVRLLSATNNKWLGFLVGLFCFDGRGRSNRTAGDPGRSEEGDGIFSSFACICNCPQYVSKPLSLGGSHVSDCNDSTCASDSGGGVGEEPGGVK
ncbi:hypothetical protein BHE74_00038057 [Ensete ventricosum]|uniref:Uncharacterized protein n=1 Tax=Ensete ventricosum TaxID=4639 RepID=A0A426YWP4_ENSVE|nr:hypothetical protein B296_00014918 [Ensete ventricosum]RWW31873.1 hypothetical protein GW17_00003483 [Ensete ventricosum]RWW55310.1 hypothetical protein BHE74_00038057 [Ensete ventricosum]RZR82538.1 hypothetical protein BHM03_00008987 [Ensete ventricosum]